MIFLDGDDLIAEGCLARLRDRIAVRPGADLYPCALVTKDELGGADELRDNYRENAPAELTGVEATLYLERQWHGQFCPMLQLTVFRREFLMEHGLRCIRGLRHQDSEFSPRALYLAGRVVPLHEPFYAKAGSSLREFPRIFLSIYPQKPKSAFFMASQGVSGGEGHPDSSPTLLITIQWEYSLP